MQPRVMHLHTQSLPCAKRSGSEEAMECISAHIRKERKREMHEKNGKRAKGKELL